MPKQSVVCYLVSLLFYGMGSLEISGINSGQFTGNRILRFSNLVNSYWISLLLCYDEKKKGQKIEEWTASCQGSISSEY